MSINVAIDGPAGAGKSTISRRAAKELGFIYVDTGALYRTVGLNAIRTGVNLDSPEEIAESVKGISVDLGYENGEQSVFLNGENVSAFIRTPEASMAGVESLRRARSARVPFRAPAGHSRQERLRHGRARYRHRRFAPRAGENLPHRLRRGSVRAAAIKNS